jgi:hypothetical protein
MCGPRREVQASERGAGRAGCSGVKRAVQVKRRAPWTNSFLGRSRAPGAPKIRRRRFCAGFYSPASQADNRHGDVFLQDAVGGGLWRARVATRLFLGRRAPPQAESFWFSDGALTGVAGLSCRGPHGRVRGERWPAEVEREGYIVAGALNSRNGRGRPAWRRFRNGARRGVTPADRWAAERHGGGVGRSTRGDAGRARRAGQGPASGDGVPGVGPRASRRRSGWRRSRCSSDCATSPRIRRRGQNPPEPAGRRRCGRSGWVGDHARTQASLTRSAVAGTSLII